MKDMLGKDTFVIISCKGNVGIVRSKVTASPFFPEAVHLGSQLWVNT
jgi:hypothetical protein